ncbi:MAG: HepT-like ribonuclease domain-containing protein [Phormidesmis sp.]
MLRDDASLLDVQIAGEKVLSFADGLDLKELEADEMRMSAIIYQIIIIGEATSRLSDEIKDEHPEVPWRKMLGMRNILAHQYDRVDFKTLWNVIHQSIPEMLEKIEPLLPQKESG